MKSQCLEKIKGGVTSVLDVIAAVFNPVLSAITGAGMLKAVLAITTAFGWLDTGSQTYYILDFVSDSVFFFLPMILAYTAAVKFECNPFVAMSLGGVLLHPNFTALIQAGEGVRFLGMPVTLATYSSSVIPIILIVWIMSYVEKVADKFSPELIKFFAVPLITLIVMAPLSLIAIGPLGSIVGDGIANVLSIIETRAGWVIPFIMGGFAPLIVMTGMQYSLVPITMSSLATVGYDTILLPGMFVSNIAQGASSLCVALKSKNKDLKQLGSSAGITALLGITEPAMYGINLKYKKPLIAAMIGGGCAGLYLGLTGTKAYAFASPGIAGIPIFIGPTVQNIINAFVAGIIAFAVTFIVTWIIGFDDTQIVESDEK